MRILRLLLLSALAGVFLGACSSAPTPTTSTAAATTTALPTAQTLAGRPTAPAPPDQFREDTADQVATTGRPQLIEVFAYD